MSWFDLFSLGYPFGDHCVLQDRTPKQKNTVLSVRGRPSFSLGSLFSHSGNSDTLLPLRAQPQAGQRKISLPSLGLSMHLFRCRSSLARTPRPAAAAPSRFAVCS
jgi:hypothetical protein